MWQEGFIDRICCLLEQDTTLRGLFVGGSLGKRQADVYSDIDLIAVVAPDDQGVFRKVWRSRLEAIAPIVLWKELHNEECVMNAITSEWQRVDLVVADEVTFRKRSQDSVKPLIDRNNLYDALPAAIAWPGPNRGYVIHLINEFLRVLGLLAVAIGRKEYLLAIAGVDLLRMMLFNLLSEEVERADKGGMMAWSRRLSAEQLSLLTTIPPVSPTRRSVIDAHLACAAAFLPRARKMAEKWAIEWPRAFEEATWQYLEREVGLTRPANAT
jgi:hypothetical protein